MKSEEKQFVMNEEMSGGKAFYKNRNSSRTLLVQEYVTRAEGGARSEPYGANESGGIV